MADTPATASPDDRLEQALGELRLSVAAELLKVLSQVSPQYFETIVLDLLHRMGYGASRADLQRVGGVGDGGIDGVISLDRLGLEKVYVQAKRWQGSVGRPDVQGFYPQSALEQQLRGTAVARDGWDVARVRTLAARFRVTPLAMATRLRSAGAMSWDGYRQWRADWGDYVSSLKPRRGGIASPVDKTLGRAGRPFVQLVLEALDANRITAVEASRYLDLRFDQIEKLRGELSSGAAGASAVDDGD